MWKYRRQRIGVEVDFDLSLPMSSHDHNMFRALFFEHSLIVFRNQRLSAERQAELWRVRARGDSRGRDGTSIPDSRC
jgi:hypothetical protein